MEKSTAKNYQSVSLRPVVCKAFEKSVNNTIVDYVEKCGLFSDFQYGFRSSRSTADVLTIVSDRIARAFNRSGAMWAVALYISKAFDRVWHAGLLHKLNFRPNIWPSFLLFSVIDGFEWFWMARFHTNILIVEFLKAPFLVLHFFYFTLMTFLVMLSVIVPSMLMILHSILSVIRHLIYCNNLNWLLYLNLIYKTLWAGQEVACFQCWKNSTGFIWPV